MYYYNKQYKLQVALETKLTKLSERYKESRSSFDKYAIESESRIQGLQLENAQLHEELSKKQKENEEQASVIIELKRKLGMDSNNSSIPPSLNRKFKKCNVQDDTHINSSISGMNLLSKLESLASAQALLPVLSKKDHTIIEDLLNSKEFSATGCYRMFNMTLNQLLLDDVANVDMGKLVNLISTERFKLVADYKSRGGQPGHKGNYLQQFANPTEVQNIIPSKCSCGCTNIMVGDKYEARQQINLKVERIITEHRLFYGKCNGCGEPVKGESSLPSNVSYHEMIRCYAVYMLDAHYMTYERLSIYFRDVFGLPISEGSINNWRKEFAKKLGDGYISKLKDILSQASYLHADETGLNVAGKNMWAHVVCNDDATLLQISHKRGMEGISASNVLNNYTGMLIVDGFSAYKSLPQIAGIQSCFAHLFRYFKDLTDNYNQSWAQKMSCLFKFALDSTKRLSSLGVDGYSEQVKSYMLNKYNQILDEGEQEIKKGRYGKGHPTVCLLNRLRKERDSVLRFLDNIYLPLTNNEAERSLRPIKVQQKISGTSLSLSNAQENLDIRSFTATCKKQSVNILDSMYKIFKDPQDFNLKINTS